MSQEPATDTNFLQNISLLYVEDDDQLREELGAFLRRHCGHLDVARNGQEGLDQFKGGKPDVVLTDVRMPIMDGLGMAEQIKALDKETPVILLTAYNDSEYLVRAIDIGVDRYVKKPADPQDIARTVCEAARIRLQSRELERVKQHYRQIVETSQEGIWEMDMFGKTIFVNRRLASMLGYPAEEMLGRPFFDFMSEESRELAVARLGEPPGTATEGVHEFETELRRQDGTALWTVVASSPMFDDEGRYSGTLAAVMDISERKRAEQALSQEKAFSDAIIAAAPGAFYVIDQKGNFVRWNTAVNDLTGLTDEQLRGSSALSIIADEDRALASAKILVAFATGASNSELRASTRKGIRTFAFSSRRFQIEGDPGGSYLAGIAIDMTERKRTEEALRREKAFSDVLIESVPGAFYALDEHGSFCRWNSYVRRLTGMSDEALSVTPPLLLVHEDERAAAANGMARAFAKGYSQCELRILSSERGTRMFLITARRFEVGGSPYLVGIGVDTTERHELEESLKYEARTDSLTGIPNRSYFMTLAEHELVRMRRYGHPLSLWMLDVDRFKEVNDQHGHQIGDQMLQAVVRKAQEVLRDLDIVGRVGGEEFAVLLPETDAEQALHVAERLRQAVDAARVPVEGGPPARCTVSIGVANLTSEDKDVDTLLNRADRALYTAKRTGRDKVCVD